MSSSFCRWARLALPVAGFCMAGSGYAQSVASVSLNPSSVVGGNSVTATVKLTKPVTATALTVALKSSTTVATVPTSVSIPHGTASTTVSVATTGVTAATTATLSASANGTVKSATLSIKPATLASLVLTPADIFGGESSIGLVTLSGVAGHGGVVVDLQSSKSSAQVPASVTVPAGSASAEFAIATAGVSASTPVTIKALIGASSKSATLTLMPAALAGMSLAPGSVVGGDPAALTVWLAGVAPAGGLTVSLSSSDPDEATPTGLITIPGGERTAKEWVPTKSVSAKTSAVLAASLKGVGVSKTLTIVPDQVSRLSLLPSSLIGGASSIATVTLTQPAPAGGATVNLSSSSSYATTPASVVVPAGVTTATFAVDTSAANQNVIATISASIGSQSVNATLTIASMPSLANSAWPKFHGNSQNTGLGIGSGSVGELSWLFPTGATIGASSPTIGPDGTVYLGSWDNNVYALNSNGSHKWAYQTGGPVFSAPTLGADGTVYVTSTDNYLYALTSTGSVKWKFQSGGFGNSSPALGLDGTIYVGAYDNNFYAIKPDGTLKWSYYIGNSSDSGPAIGADGTVYVGSDDGILYAFSPLGALEWAFFSQGVITSSPALGSDGTIYFGAQDDNVYAVNPDGTLKWSLKTGNQVWSSPAIGPDGTVYVGSTDNGLYAITPTGTVKWVYHTGQEILNSSPAVGSDGTVYVGSRDNYVYAISSAGTLKWRYKTQGGVDSSPAIGKDGTIYIGSNDNNVYAIH